MRNKREPGWAPTAADMFRSLTILNLIVCGIIVATGTGIGFLMSPEAGWGWLLGSSVATASLLFTLIVMIVTENLNVQSEVGPMAGSYLVKVLLLVAVLTVLQGRDFYSPVAFGLGFLLALVANLVVDSVTIIRSRG